jgi:hypothetical protein
VVAVKAPGFGERKTSYLEDIAILTGATMVKDELGISLEKADESVLGIAAKVVISKESCTIVGDGKAQVRQDGGGRRTGCLPGLCALPGLPLAPGDGPRGAARRGAGGARALCAERRGAATVP